MFDGGAGCGVWGGRLRVGARVASRERATNAAGRNHGAGGFARVPYPPPKRFAAHRRPRMYASCARACTSACVHVRTHSNTHKPPRQPSKRKRRRNTHARAHARLLQQDRRDLDLPDARAAELLRQQRARQAGRRSPEPLDLSQRLSRCAALKGPSSGAHFRNFVVHQLEPANVCRSRNFLVNVQKQEKALR